LLKQKKEIADAKAADAFGDHLNLPAHPLPVALFSHAIQPSKLSF